MTPEQKKCKEYLQCYHIGKENIVSAACLSAALGISERNIRTVVRVLRRDHKCPIGSSMGRPSGYYWAATPEELAETIGPLRALATDVQVTLRAMEWNYVKLGGQMQLLDFKN